MRIFTKKSSNVRKRIEFACPTTCEFWILFLVLFDRSTWMLGLFRSLKAMLFLCLLLLGTISVTWRESAGADYAADVSLSTVSIEINSVRWIIHLSFTMTTTGSIDCQVRIPSTNTPCHHRWRVHSWIASDTHRRRAASDSDAWTTRLVGHLGAQWSENWTRYLTTACLFRVRPLFMWLSVSRLYYTCSVHSIWFGLRRMDGQCSRQCLFEISQALQSNRHTTWTENILEFLLAWNGCIRFASHHRLRFGANEFLQIALYRPFARSDCIFRYDIRTSRIQWENTAYDSISTGRLHEQCWRSAGACFCQVFNVNWGLFDIDFLFTISISQLIRFAYGKIWCRFSTNCWVCTIIRPKWTSCCQRPQKHCVRLDSGYPCCAITTFHRSSATLPTT